jgi:glycosyltransferase involved in cell wall biosynthesis
LFVRKLFRRFKPQIIHSHGYKENLIAYLSTNLGTVSKLVETQHGLPEVDRRLTCMKHKFILWYNFRLLQCHFHAVVAVSKDIESILLGKLGFREHAVFFIHNGIKLLDAIKEKKGGGAIRIESCGRLYPVKDYLLLVKIVRECMNRNLKACFGLAGDGPELPKIKALAENYGLGAKFRLRGYLDNMGVFYQGLDIFINTSIHEGNPMSVLEAMAHQVPVIAPRVGAPRNYK